MYIYIYMKIILQHLVRNQKISEQASININLIGLFLIFENIDNGFEYNIKVQS